MHQRQNFGVSVELPIVPGESGTAEFKFSPCGSGHCADVGVACFDMEGAAFPRDSVKAAFCCCALSKAKTSWSLAVL